MEIRKNLVDASKYGTKCPYTMNPEFITVHNTYNDATAENEVSFMIHTQSHFPKSCGHSSISFLRSTVRCNQR